MNLKSLSRRTIAFLSIVMVLGGAALGIWSCSQLGQTGATVSEAEIIDTQAETPSDSARAIANSEVETETLSLETEPTPAAQESLPVVIAVDPGVPAPLHQVINRIAVSNTEIFTAATDAVSVTLRVDTSANGSGSSQDDILYQALYAAATRFDTLDNDVSADFVRALWQGTTSPDHGYATIAVISDTLPGLSMLLGTPGPTVTGYADVDAVTDAVWADTISLALLPFDTLIPELAVLRVDGQTPVENAALFDESDYPFIVPIYVHSSRADAPTETVLAEIEAQSGGTNRRDDRLTVVAMTGVTAMVRLTAQQMDQYGPLWPAQFISDTLAAADITAISNEVPFVPGCTTNIAPDNLTFCSPPEYMETLEAVGVDIIGLTGNHQNDYGRDDALTSLQIYEEAGLPVYGGGVNKEAAFKPLYLEHNGNRLAFVGANSYGPPFAWATDNGPGSAEFDLNIMSATIRNIKARDLAEVVFAEFQYQESYDVSPLFDQRQDFRAVSRTGADIVTGVQSHVPQAMEFEDGALILYGLGNLFFDQMQGTTRDGLIIKHTIYEGRHISTQIFTTVIYDYGQPHWATPEERAQILNRVFAASFWERP